MKRYEMVKSHEEFNEIINKGNRLKGKYAYIFSKEKEFDKFKEKIVKLEDERDQIYLGNEEIINKVIEKYLKEVKE